MKHYVDKTYLGNDFRHYIISNWVVVTRDNETVSIREGIEISIKNLN